MADSVSRRTFLAKASAGVAGGLAAGVVMSSGLSLDTVLTQAAAPAKRTAAPDVTPLGADVIAHVRDASRGEVSLLVGNREIVHHDPELVGRILREVRRSAQEV